MKRIIGIFLIIILLVSITACSHVHKYGQWEEAIPATCGKEGSYERVCECGEKETRITDAKEHVWLHPTCTTTKYCYNCNIAEGEPLGHTTDNGFCANCYAPISSPDKIGRILDVQSFESEISKRIDLSEYNIDTEGSNYICRLKEEYFLPENILSNEITLDETKLTLPCTVSDLINSGWEITNASYTDVSELNLDKICSFEFLDFKNKNGKEFSVYVEGEPSKLKDCVIMQFSISYFLNGVLSINNLDQNKADFNIMNGITNKTSLDDLISKLGKPNILYYDYATDCVGNPSSSGVQLTYYFKNNSGETGSVHFAIDTLMEKKANNSTAINYITHISYRP